MNTVQDTYFARKFSLTLYKNLKLSLGEMSFYKDFVRDRRGDLYPLLESCGAFTETVTDGLYRFRAADEGAYAVRLIGQHFPYATYEITPESLNGTLGLCLRQPDGAEARLVFVGKEGRLYVDGYPSESEAFAPGMSLIITCRGKNFDIYLKTDGFPKFFRSVCVPAFSDICREKIFTQTAAALYVSGEVSLRAVRFYMDCGVSQADMRPIRCENGEVLTENGKIYLTVSIRMQEECYQGILSWVPGTSEFALTGALFYDAGDGVWGNDVAASVLYHRKRKCWYLWVCSFCHGHRLAHAVFEGDIRFGVNVVDVTLMPPLPADGDDTLFLGKEGDEDPDFLFDETSGKWLMTVCRLKTDESGTNYRYFLFESEHPFEGYRFVSHAQSGAETGGSIVRDGGGLAFVCGSGFDRRAEYHIYRLPDLSSYRLMQCDYDDGGFRGWGTVIPLTLGSRRRLFWLTFDRHNASDYTWSYGNLYCFEGVRKEIPEKMS
ncbi:MAG: hypothetical protein ACI4RV_05500 [Eubacteriales bacterium]